MDDVTRDLKQTIDAIRNMGIGIEIDDFGTGHASFASVLALKPDRLKIDRMFARGIDTDDHRRDLLRGLIDLAKGMAIDTIVEGVETQGEATVIGEIGANVLQGFAFSRPLGVDDFITWAKSWERRVA